MVVMSDFISEMNQGYMLVCAQRIDPQQLIHIVEKYPDRDSSSALWIKLNDLRYRVGINSDATKARKNSRRGGQGKGGKNKGATAPADDSILADKISSRTRLCTFFAKGECTSGDKCQFRHTSTSSKL